MSTKNEVFYESGPTNVVEETEDDASARQALKVSFISDDTQGRVLQQAFSVCPKSDDETLKNRYNRLRSEIVLLHERIAYENQKSAELKQQHVDDIQTFLMALKNNSVDKPDSDTDDPTIQRLAALNNRIKDLEWTLGIVADQQPSSTAVPLLKVLEDLKVRISILSPDLLSRITKRLQESSSFDIKLSRSDLSNDLLNLTRDDKNNNIAEMHELIKRWDSSCKDLPNVVAHLTTSRQLHKDAERVCRKYAQLMALKSDIQKLLHFQQKLDDLNSKRNSERIESIRQRISAIQETK